MMALLRADDLPADVASAEAILVNHMELKGEMDARKDLFDTFKLKGLELVEVGHYACHEVISSRVSLEMQLCRKCYLLLLRCCTPTIALSWPLSIF